MKTAHIAVSRLEYWWPVSESNQGHADFQSAALPTELTGHIEGSDLNVNVGPSQIEARHLNLNPVISQETRPVSMAAEALTAWFGRFKVHCDACLDNFGFGFGNDSWMTGLSGLPG
jgi:hypothetical protein